MVSHFGHPSVLISPKVLIPKGEEDKERMRIGKYVKHKWKRLVLWGGNSQILSFAKSREGSPALNRIHD